MKKTEKNKVDMKMKALKKIIVPLVTHGFLGSVVVNFGGCSSQNPLAPKTGKEMKQISFLTFGGYSNTLSKTVSSSK